MNVSNVRAGMATGPRQSARLTRFEIDRPKLLHMITSVGIGGAQMMLAKLLEQHSGTLDSYDQSVLSLMPPGELAARIERTGVPIHSIGARSSIPSPIAAARLIGITRRLRPDVIVGWMHHGATAAWYASRWSGSRPSIIWNVRHSLSDMAHEKPVSRFLLRHNARRSSKVDAIIYNSHTARAQYAAHGYSDDRAVVIPNGFDCNHFRPRDDARQRLGAIFGVPEGRTVIGMVARNHPMKDPATLVAAMRRLWEKGHDLHLLIAGTGMQGLDRHIGQALESIPRDCITLSDQRLDVAEWLPGLDLLVLPSAWGEGFPNIVGEAMASGVPCVATDIGDSAWVVGETGWIVPARDPDAMRGAIEAFIGLSNDGVRELKQAARSRIQSLFSLDAVAGDYSDLYDSVLSESGRTSAAPEGA